jgi:hypothetical protein
MNEPETKRTNKMIANMCSMIAVQPSELFAIEGGVAPQHLKAPLYPYDDDYLPPPFPRPGIIV